MAVVRTPPVRVEDWEELRVPDGYRAEVILGELVVTPSGDLAHSRAVSRLVRLLGPACPPDWEPMAGPEWRVAPGGIVAMAPIPDVVVVPVDAAGPALTATPLLAVEVLSPSDHRRLEREGLTRREGKLIDYANNGLADYLEVDLSGPEPEIVRYELRGGRLVGVARAVGDDVLRTDRPFPYEIRPAELG